MQQPYPTQDPYQPPQAPYAPMPPQATDAMAARVKSVAGVAIVLLALRGGLGLFFRFVWMVMPRLDFRTHRTVSTAFQGVKLVLALTAFIVFLVWTYRAISALRARGEQTSYSPGMAVGCWFIPFANFVMPPLAIADAWRRATGSGAGIVGGWWAAYLVFTVLEVVITQPIIHDAGTAMAVGWFDTLLCLGVYALWILIVRGVTEALSRASVRA